MDLIRILLCLFVPPLGVLLEAGLGKHFFINLVLTLFGWLPGVVHAIWVMTRRPQAV